MAAPRVRPIHANRVAARAIYARVVYADEVVARQASIGRSYDYAGVGQVDARSLGTDVLQADVLYARTVDAEWLEVSELYARRVRLGR